jgi:para-aminobenzoate synthetase / 4-amino-4-deoxychorismate lyase
MDIQLESGAMRIVVVPGADRFETEVSFRETEERFGPVALHSLTLAGGLGSHKWADRSLLDEAQDTLPEGALPLIVDEEGLVLEASRANVFAVRDGVLLTPPLDGRILPGVTRMRVIGLAGELGTEAREASLSLGDLTGADEVFLTGSVRGIEPVGTIDGTVLASGGDVTSELSAELRRTWVRAKVG